MKLAVPIDIFSKRRVIYNITIYFFYAAIFLASFVISYIAVHSFEPLLFRNLLLLFDVFLLIAVIKFFVFNFFNFKRFALYSNDLYDICKTAFLVTSSFVLLLFLKPFCMPANTFPLLFLLIDALLSLCAIVVFNAAFRTIYSRRSNLMDRLLKRYSYNSDSKRYLIVGAGVIGQSLYKTLLRHTAYTYDIAGFLDDNPELIGKQIQGVRIYGPIRDVVDIAGKLHVSHLIIAMPSAPARRIREIIDSVRETKISVSTVPSYVEVIEGNVKIDSIREIIIEDLLSRDKIEIDVEMISEKISNNCILITGAAGSIGSEICRQLIRFNPSTVIALDQAETPLFFLERELRSLSHQVQIIPIVADITNRHRLISVFQEYRPGMVLHAAAYKHVPMMEENFKEAIINNVLGTKNVADLANNFQTDLFVMISTDKAVNPTSIMGLTKRIAEVYIQSLDQVSPTKYITVRFGNVLDSAGNVVQVFKQQIARGGPVTVTHPDMTRYFMITSEAVQLVLQAGFSGNGGEIFLLDMGEPMRILDLAKIMIKIAGYEVGRDIEVEFTGLRPGEKLFEELHYDEEDLLKTPHPKIFVWKSRRSNRETVNQSINELIDNVYNRDREEITDEIMKKLVPEFLNGSTSHIKVPQLLASNF